MDTTTAQSSVKALNTELFYLQPSALITLFEIDISQIMTNDTMFLPPSELYFRFHNNIKLFSNSIFFLNNEYFPLPVRADGFDINAKGTLPTPKLSLSSQDGGYSIFALFKSKLQKYGDCVGAKVTRIRTFLKNIDAKNFLNNDIPAGFSPNAAYFRDVYYIDRKSNESKFNIEFELASLLDVEGVQLPGRLVLANRCVAQYRGEGCLYEYSKRKSDIHGLATLPEAAPPVANDRDEKFSEVLKGTNISDRGRYEAGVIYNKGDSVYVTKGNINYYFVAMNNGTINISPPNINYWLSDACSKTVAGCRCRYGIDGAVFPGTSAPYIAKGNLMFNGFPAASKVS